jgi:hypothetical protein
MQELYYLSIFVYIEVAYDMVKWRDIMISSVNHNIPYPFKTQWQLYVPPDLTNYNSVFFPHSVFTDFILFSE